MTTLIADKPPVFTNDSPLAQPCRFVVLYNDMPARTQAERLTGRLRATFSTEIELQFSWWMFSVLRDPGLAHLAIAEAAAADVLLFFLGLSRHLPQEVIAFNERWLDQRQGNEGLLAYSLEEETEEAETIEHSLALNRYFRETARRAHLDFIAPDLTHSPPAQARQTTEDLSRILHLITQLPV